MEIGTVCEIGAVIESPQETEKTKPLQLSPEKQKKQNLCALALLNDVLSSLKSPSMVFVLQGDVLITKCTYNTEDRSTPTVVNSP